MAHASDELHKKRKLKLNSKQFCSKYRRLERSDIDFSPENVSNEIKNHFMPPENLQDAIYLATKDEPFDGLIHFTYYDLQEILPRYNRLLVYRLLKLCYGKPDVIAVWSTTSDDSKTITLHAGMQTDWSYCVHVHERLIAEIRSSLGNILTSVRFWLREPPNEGCDKTLIRNSATQFLEDFRDAVDNNLHLFEESFDIDSFDRVRRVGTLNVFFENYSRAKNLLATAREFETNPKIRDILLSPPSLDMSSEKDDVLTRLSALCQGSAFLFTLSIEAFINVIYSSLIKDEFRHDLLKRATVHAESHIRLLTMHLFCRGFERPVMKVGDALWEDFQELRKFRNTRFHGSVLEEHDTYLILEEGLFFTYAPAREFRGRKAEKKAGKALPLSGHIGFETVAAIQQIVDAHVDEVLSAMNGETRNWVQSWLHESLIPRI